MHQIALLGTGLIGRFHTMSLQNFRGKDEIKVVCASREAEVVKFAQEFGIPVGRMLWPQQFRTRKLIP